MYTLIKSKYVLMLVTLFIFPGCDSTGFNESSNDTDKSDMTVRTIRDHISTDILAPELVVVPAGTNTLGDITGAGIEIERPTYKVTIDKPFAIGKYEVTFSEYEYFCEQTGCKKPDDEGWGRGRRPVIDINWYDAIAYVKWLSKKTGESYFLPSEAQWEYAARAGTQTNYWWGNEPGDKLAQCGGCAEVHRCATCKDVPLLDDGTVTVGSFNANPFGLYDVHGNVMEWTTDCDSKRNSNQPSDGSTRLNGDCTKHIIKDGSWWNNSRFIRSSVRGSAVEGSSYKSKHLGFRVAREINE